MAVAATTVKKLSQNSPIKRARRRRCERKQTPQNRVSATTGKSWEKTVEAASLPYKQEVGGSSPPPPTIVLKSFRIGRRFQRRICDVVCAITPL